MKRFFPIIFLFFLPSLACAATLAKTTQTLPVSYSPNELYLPAFLKALESANKSNPHLSTIETDIRTEAATSTDFVQTFLKQLQSKNTLKKQADSGSFFDQIISLVSSFFIPTPAVAATGLPFGGPLVYTFPCTCDADVWMLFVGPTSSLATSDKFLSYELGSQVFASYNIPYTLELLGFYSPAGPVCYVGFEPYCYPVTTQGIITPVVGSAP